MHEDREWFVEMLEMSQLQDQQRSLNGRGVSTEEIGQKIEGCRADHDIHFKMKVEESLANVMFTMRCAIQTQPHIPRRLPSQEKQVQMEL